VKRRVFLPAAALLIALSILLWAGDALDRLPQQHASPGPVLAPPYLSPPPGVYHRDVRLTIRPTDPQGKIIFTTDGTTPTLELGTLYERPLRLDALTPGVTVIRAMEILHGVSGPITSATYALGVQSDLPLLSLAVAPADLWAVEDGLLTNVWGRGDAWERAVQVMYFAPEGDFVAGNFTAPGGLRVHGTESPDADKQSLRLYFRREYGMARLEYSLFANHPHQPNQGQSYKRLLLQAGDRSGRWTLFRDQLVTDIAGELDLPVAQGRFVRLFVNGESWGVYRLAERIDRFFLEDNYGLLDADLVQDGKPREGSDADWDALVDWVDAHDLSDPGTYATVAAQIDLGNFTDYAIVQLYFGFPASDFYAARPRGGRWFFLYGGGSQAFAAYAGAPLAALQGEVVGVVAADFADSDFALLLRKLLAAPVYRRSFTQRLSILLNTVLTPDVIQRHAQTWAELLQNDMAYEVARWPTPFLWPDHVESLTQDFAEGRASAVWSQTAEMLGIGQAVDVAFRIEAPGAGRVYLDGLPVVESPAWRGRFFAGDALSAIAVPEPGYAFVGWDVGPSVFVSALASPALTLTIPYVSVDDSIPQIKARFALLPDDDDARPNGDAMRPDDVVINEVWLNDNGTYYASVGNRPIEGDWVELWVRRPQTVDLRGWRLTDNDTRTGMEEGSLIFPALDALSAVPRDTVILILATESARNTLYFPEDDVDPRDRRLLFYVGNGNLDVLTDPGFGLSLRDDNLVLLAPGPTADFSAANFSASEKFADVGVDFVAEGRAVTPYTFGVLADGVTFDRPFRRLGADDGAFFTGRTSNDALRAWVVDPPAYQSGDEVRADSPNLITPGKLNPHQRWSWLFRVP